MLVNGTGYVSQVLKTNDSNFISAAFAPNGSHFAACQDNGTIFTWRANGSQVAQFKWAVTYLLHCYLAFLDNQTLLVGINDQLRAFSLNGTVLWNHSLAAFAGDVGSLEVSANGSKVLVGFGSRALLWDRALNTTREYPSLEGSQGLFVSMSGDGGIVAVGSGNATLGRVVFYGPSGEVIGEVPRHAAVAVSGDGRWALLGRRDAHDRNTLLVVDLEARPIALTPHVGHYATSEDVSGFYPAPNRIFASPSGNFFAFAVHQDVRRCPPDDLCVGSDEFFVRVFERADPTRDLGFAGGVPLGMTLRDDGSAVALSWQAAPQALAVFNATGPSFDWDLGGDLVHTVADPYATPPVQDHPI